MRLLKILLLVLFFSLLARGQADAHGYLVRSSPADRSVVLRAPQQVQVWFSEGLEARFSTISVFDQTGQQVDLGDGGIDEQNPAKLVVSLPDDLLPGAYLVRIRPVFTDGHAAGDTLVFWVGEQTGEIEAEGASNRILPLEALWRIGLILSLSLLAGTISTYALVLRPAWHNPRWRLGGLPPRVMQRLSALLWLSLLASLVWNILALFQITISLFNADISQVLRDSLWEIVLQGSNFGDVWKTRMLLLIGMVAVQIIAMQQARNRPQSTHVLWLLNGGLALVTLYTLSRISHAGGATLWTDATILADYLHLIAVALWVGGLVVLSLVLRPALTPLDVTARGLALHSVLKRFSLLGLICVSVIIATGLYASSINLYQPADLPETNYGLTLIAKWLLMLPLLGLALLHQLWLHPERLHKFAQRFQAYRHQLPRTIIVETLFAVSVLAAAAILSGTPPPSPENNPTASVPTRQVTVEGYDITLAISPGAIGANSYDVRIQQGGQPATLKQVQLRFSYPDLGRYTDPLLLEEAEPGLWIGADGEINRAAEWLALIDIWDVENQSVRVALPWQFDEESVLSGRRSPSWLHWLSGVGVVAVLGFWTTPLLLTSILKLDWSPANLAIAITATLLLIAISVGGVWLIEQTGESVRQSRDTPPDVINPVFPDQTSVAAGQLLYEQICATCHGVNLDTTSDEVPSLLADITTRKDEDLYRILNRGILGRHQYGIELSEEDKWHVINYIRRY